MLQAWEDRKGPIVLTTADQDGTPGAAYETYVSKFGDGHLTVANSFFSKTQAKINAGSEGNSCQVKDSIEYATPVSATTT